VVYSTAVLEIVTSNLFDEWFDGLRDRKARLIILARLRRLSLGNIGDAKTVGGGISEARIDFGPGYRIYFQQRGGLIIIVLAGGDKASQANDIATARDVAAKWKD
jgi:putative addiction module killer protein